MSSLGLVFGEIPNDAQSGAVASILGPMVIPKRTARALGVETPTGRAIKKATLENVEPADFLRLHPAICIQAASFSSLLDIPWSRVQPVSDGTLAIVRIHAVT